MWLGMGRGSLYEGKDCPSNIQRYCPAWYKKRNYFKQYALSMAYQQHFALR
jgi:hypothetical protein